MPEEDLETTELKEHIDQRLEDHEHSGHGGHGKEASPSWLKYLSLSTAIIAVIAAVASLESGAKSNEAILEQGEATLKQSKATDAWGYFQAKSIKATITENSRKLVADRPELAAGFTTEVERYRRESEEKKRDADELEAQVAESSKRSKELMEQHHLFAIAVTFLQVAIALAAIGALTRKQPLWYLSIAVSLGGLVMFARGFL